MSITYGIIPSDLRAAPLRPQHTTQRGNLVTRELGRHSRGRSTTPNRSTATGQWYMVLLCSSRHASSLDTSYCSLNLPVPPSSTLQLSLPRLAGARTQISLSHAAGASPRNPRRRAIPAPQLSPSKRRNSRRSSCPPRSPAARKQQRIPYSVRHRKKH